MSFAVMKPALHLIWWQARRREVMRQQRIEEEAVADSAEREYQVTNQFWEHDMLRNIQFVFTWVAIALCSITACGLKE